MILQIQNGTIDPTWVITILVGIVAWFAVRTILKADSRMEKFEIRGEKQDHRMDLITRVLVQMLTKMGGENDFYNDLSRQLNVK